MIKCVSTRVHWGFTPPPWTNWLQHEVCLLYICRKKKKKILPTSSTNMFCAVRPITLCIPTEWIYMCICVCVGESDLIGLHPAGGLLYEIKLDEGESSALTWTPPSAMATEQQQHNNNAVLGLVLHVQRRERPCISTRRTSLHLLSFFS